MSILDLLGFSALLSAIMVITIKNPVISVIFLIGVFLNITLYLVWIGLTYLGLVYLIVYIGAIAILFLFVIMMLNLRLVELIETGQEYTKSLPIAFSLVAFLIYIIIEIVPNYTDTHLLINTVNNINELVINTNSASVNTFFNNSLSEITLIQFTQIEAIGHSLYTYGAIWLIITAVILMLAMIGPILLCLRD